MISRNGNTGSTHSSFPRQNHSYHWGSTDSITCWKDRGKFGWDSNFQTCRKWQKPLPLLALGLSWPSVLFQPEWGLCLIKGNNKTIRKDHVQFSMSTVSYLILMCNILISSQNGSIWDLKRQRWHPCINSVPVLPFHWEIRVSPDKTRHVH